MKKLIITLMTVLTIGCMSVGTKFDGSDVRAMKPGVTTYEEAVAKLGKPKSTVYRDDGSILVTWVYATSMPGSGRAAKILFNKDVMVKVVGISE